MQISASCLRYVCYRAAEYMMHTRLCLLIAKNSGVLSEPHFWSTEIGKVSHSPKNVDDD